MSQANQLTAVLQLVRLKGRVAPAVVAESLGLDEAEVSGLLAQLLESGAVTESNGNLRIAPAGREQLADRITAERDDIDQVALASAYDRFHHLNTRFKQVVTAWQIRGEVPNDHSDQTYDAGIVEQLVSVHRSFNPLLVEMMALAPRLASYPRRLAHALQRLLAGDHGAFAKPIVDSYHTVWFELHEDLIGMLGLSREDEAAAGRAE